MTRKELLNSPVYWQEIAENQCYRENIDYTLQLVDKKQIIDEVCNWIYQHKEAYIFKNNEGTWFDSNLLISDLLKKQ